MTKEHSLVQQIKSWTGSNLIGDDCALLPGQQLASTDTLVEGTHFLPSISSYEDIGWKAAAVNLSDIAAMGGIPEHLLVSITLPTVFAKAQFARLYKGIIDCAREHKAAIVGGDLTTGAKLSLSLTVLGRFHENGCLRRSGAQPGDLVIVSGDFGASRAGLWYLQERASRELEKNEIKKDEIETIESKLTRSRFFRSCDAHRRPKPRLAAGWLLAKSAGSRAAAMDSSDGLADALVQIALSSNVSIEVDLDLLPIHSETREIASLAGADINQWALYGGEDYQLVGCVSEKTWQNWKQDLSSVFTVVGKVREGLGVKLKIGQKDGPPIELDKSFQQIFF
jgi:thiamine-monophosphate kinase